MTSVSTFPTITYQRPTSARDSTRRRRIKSPPLKKFKDHEEMASRLTKSFYYGKRPQTDRPSLAMTGVMVEQFTKDFPKSLDQLNVEYAAEVSRNACVSPCSLMLALVYLDRLRYRNPEYLQTVSSSEMFLVSMMVASKFLYDEGEEDEVFNDEWAASADMETDKVNRLERDFLAALDWNLFVSVPTLTSILEKLEARIAFSEALKRGWFSYSDLDAVSHNLSAADCLHLLLDRVCKVMLVCSVAYAAAVLTIVGSACVVHRGLVPLGQRSFQTISSSWTPTNDSFRPEAFATRSSVPMPPSHAFCLVDPSAAAPGTWTTPGDYRSSLLQHRNSIVSIVFFLRNSLMGNGSYSLAVSDSPPLVKFVAR